MVWPSPAALQADLLLLYALVLISSNHVAVVSCSSGSRAHRHRRGGYTRYELVQHNRSAADCREPSDLDTQFAAWLRESQQSVAVADLPVAMPSEQYLLPQLNTSDNESQSVCSQPLDTSASSGVMDRALCPWTWRTNRNEERQPVHMNEAQCLCRNARGNVAALCVPFHRNFPVLRRIKCDEVTGEYKYVRGFVSIAVGCHSVLPISVRPEPYDRQLNSLLQQQQQQQQITVQPS